MAEKIAGPDNSHIAYTYDLGGRRTEVKDALGHVTTYGYDAANRLTSVTDALSHVTEYKYNNRSYMTEVIDASGQHYQFTPDALGRVTQLTRNAHSLTLGYYAVCNRTTSHQSSSINGETTQYTYDGQDVILDTLSDGHTVEYLNGPGIDNKLAVNDSKQGVFYLLHDQLGSVRAVTDATGMAIDHASSDSFGQGVASGVTRYAFTGREWDEDAGLYYYRARWYDQQHGRFISEDPIGLRGGINLYGYVKNNPLNRKDPSGLRDSTGDRDPNEAYYTTYNQGKNGCGCYSGGGGAPLLVAGTVAVADGPEPGPADAVAAGVLVGYYLVAISLPSCERPASPLFPPITMSDGPGEVIRFPPSPRSTPLVPPLPPPPKNRGPVCLRALQECLTWASGDPLKQNLCVQSHTECVKTNLPVIFPNGRWVPPLP